MEQQTNTNNTTELSRQSTTLAQSPLAKALAKRKGTGAGSVLLLDVSSSMCDYIHDSSERMTKIDMLRNLVSQLRLDGAAFSQIVFSDGAEFTDIIPNPSGGTNMIAAIELAATRKPKQVVLVSDGEPNDQEGTLAAAHMHLQDVVIDTFFVGTAGSRGEKFLQQLSTIFKGQHGVSTKLGELTSGIRLALNAGSAEDVKKASIAL